MSTRRKSQKELERETVRVVDFYIFVDESGQLREFSGETSSVAGLAMPVSDAWYASVFVSQIRKRLYGDATPGRPVKAKMWSAGEWASFARLIQGRNWPLYYIPVVSDEACSARNEGITELAADHFLQTVGTDIVPGLQQLGIEVTARDLFGYLHQSLVAKHRNYLVALLDLVELVVEQTIDRNFIGLPHFVLDERLPPESGPWLGIITTKLMFERAEDYRNTPAGAVIGKLDWSRTVLEVASDIRSDGLVLADAVAFMTGAAERGHNLSQAVAEAYASLFPELAAKVHNRAPKLHPTPSPAASSPPSRHRRRLRRSGT